MRLLNITTTFLFLLFCYSISYSQIWEKTSNPPGGASTYSIRTAFENGSVVQFSIASDGAGLFKSTDGGINWENIGLVGVVLTDMAFINDFDEGNYIVSASNGIHKSTDFGETWTHHTSGIEGLFITAMASSNEFNDEIVIGTATNGAFRSFDNGETWEQFGTGLEKETVRNILGFSILSVDFTWEATTQDGGFWVYDEATNMWEQQNAGNENHSNDSDIAVDSQDQILLASGNEILYTDISNIQWELEVKHPGVNGFEITPDGQTIASSYGWGIIIKWPGATEWAPFSEGLPFNDGFIDVFNMDLDDEGFLWAAVWVPLTSSNPANSGGIFKTINPVTDVEDISSEIPNRFNLEQNYPNPFNPTTKIKYSVPQLSFVTLKVYDVLGREVLTLANEERPIGSYEVEFNATGLSSGVYFYSLRTGSFTQTKKMLLLK